MSRLPFETQVRIIASLAECGGIRSTEKVLTEGGMGSACRVTILKLLLDVGEGCARVHDRMFRGLRCPVLQLDEQHSIVFKKTKNLKEKDDPNAVGEQWTWVAFDTTSRAVVSYLVGKRSAENARALADDLYGRIEGAPFISADGLRAYPDALSGAFGADPYSFGQLVKMYAGDEKGGREGNYKGAHPVAIVGDVDLRKVHTSYVERQNLTNRVFNKRFVRKTLCFSKSIRHHKAQVALSYFYYNFCCIHRTLRVTPAMALKVTDRVWSVADVVRAALAEPEAPPAPAPALPPPGGGRPSQLPLAGMPALRLIRGGKV